MFPVVVTTMTDAKPAKKTAPDHPPYAILIAEAIRELKERTGSSAPAITKKIGEKYGSKLKSGVISWEKQVSQQLKRMAASGKLVKVKNSYKLSDELKKEKKPKKPRAKKPAAEGGEKKKVAKKPASAKKAKKPAAEKKEAGEKKAAATPKKKAAAKPKKEADEKKPKAKKSKAAAGEKKEKKAKAPAVKKTTATKKKAPAKPKAEKKTKAAKAE